MRVYMATFSRAKRTNAPRNQQLASFRGWKFRLIPQCVSCPREAGEAEKAAHYLKAVDRMAYSIAAWIEATNDVRLEDVCCDYFMCRRRSPHEAFAKAMAGAEARTSPETVNGEEG